MSQGGRKKQMSKGRKRSLPGVASDAGKAQVEAARHWMCHHLNISSQIREPKPDLLWTKLCLDTKRPMPARLVPRQIIIAETGFAREMAVDVPWHYEAVIERWKLKMGIVAPNRIITKIVQVTPPDELLKTLRALAEDLEFV